MGRGSLQGTPWHYEYLKSDNEGKKRSKKKCIHHHKGKCNKTLAKCPGTTHCTAYRETPEPSTIPQASKSKSFTSKKEIKQQKDLNKLHGKFIIKFIGENEKEYIIGKNISKEAEIVKKVYMTEVGEELTINDEKAIVIEKDLK